VLARVRPPDAPRVLIVSIPKAGTHLAERALCLHPALHRRLTRTLFPTQLERLDRALARQRPGEVLCSHLHHTPETVRVVDRHRPKVLLVVRDPRDVVISRAHYALDLRKHEWHRAVRELPDVKDRIRLFIAGDDRAGIAPIATVLRRYEGWLERSASVVRFEELVGPGTRVDALDRAFAELGIPSRRSALERIADRLVSPVSVTFRRGRAGEWSGEFDGELRAAFEGSAGAVLARYGYS